MPRWIWAAVSRSAVSCRGSAPAASPSPSAAASASGGSWSPSWVMRLRDAAEHRDRARGSRGPSSRSPGAACRRPRRRSPGTPASSSRRGAARPAPGRPRRRPRTRPRRRAGCTTPARRGRARSWRAGCRTGSVPSSRAATGLAYTRRNSGSSANSTTPYGASRRASQVETWGGVRCRARRRPGSGAVADTEAVPRRSARGAGTGTRQRAWGGGRAATMSRRSRGSVRARPSQVAVGADGHRARRHLRGAEAREHEILACRDQPADAGQRLEAVHHGHREVDHHEVGVLGATPRCRPAVAGLGTTSNPPRLRASRSSWRRSSVSSMMTTRTGRSRGSRGSRVPARAGYARRRTRVPWPPSAGRSRQHRPTLLPEPAARPERRARTRQQTGAT